MTLTIFGQTLGTLPGWVPPWAIPLVMIHLVMFAVMFIPAWVALARARTVGLLSILLIIPVLGLLILCPIFMGRVLPWAQWSRFWGLMILVPGLNIFFLWIFAFAPWKRRYVPPPPEDEDEPMTGASRAAPATASSRHEPKLDKRSREASGPTIVPPPAEPSGNYTMMAGAQAPALPADPPSLTMMPGMPGTPAPQAAPPAAPQPLPTPRNFSGPPGTIIAGRPGAPAPAPTPPAPPPPPPPPPPPAYVPPVPAPPPPPAYQAPPPMPAYNPRAPEPEPPRPRPHERTKDLTLSPPPAAQPEQATMRASVAQRRSGRTWRILGADDLSSGINFSLSEGALVEADGGLLIGRSARAHLVIDHESVSRNHARFLLINNTLCIEDLDSMNGTWVDGMKLDANAPTTLNHESLLEVGKVKLRIHMP